VETFGSYTLAGKQEDTLAKSRRPVHPSSFRSVMLANVVFSAFLGVSSHRTIIASGFVTNAQKPWRPISREQSRVISY
jgi:hypothetical protein